MVNEKLNNSNLAEDCKQNSEKFNYFEYFKFILLKEYFTKQFNGESTDEFTIQIRNYNSINSTWFYKNGALKFVKINTAYNKDGKQISEVTVKDINLEAKAISKENKEFNVFNSFDIAKAVKSALKTKAVREK